METRLAGNGFGQSRALKGREWKVFLDEVVISKPRHKHFITLCCFFSSVWLTHSLIYTDTCFPSILRTHPEPERKVHSLIRLSFSRTYSLVGHKDETAKCEASSRSFIIACHFESDTVWLSLCVNHFLTSSNKGRRDKVSEPLSMSVQY